MIRFIGQLCFALTFSGVMLAQEFVTLVNFNQTNGAQPQAPLIQGLDGDLYGTTENGGTTNYGELFKVSPTGPLSTVYEFCWSVSCAWTDAPFAGVLQTRDGDLYGTTWVGGSKGDGNVFRVSGGMATDLAEFDVKNGANPPSALIEGMDGNFYGLAAQGAKNSPNCFAGVGCGAVYEVTPSGVLSALYAFCSLPECADGTGPSGSLLQTADGSFYGTAFSGGSFANGGCLAGAGCGTIFKLSPEGIFTLLHTFSGSDGGNPYVVNLIQGTDGELYGTTTYGGPNNGCNDFGVGCGTIFKITTGGILTTLLNFCGQTSCADGAEPNGGLIQASDGNFYGTTYAGGAYNYGTVFRLTAAGKYTVLHNFCAQSGCPDGEYPDASLFQATDGSIYGVTYQGGSGQGLGTGGGTVFRMNLGLPRFVAPLPNFGKVGQIVSILGNGLRTTSSVTFNGEAAQFKIASGTYLNAVVPSGAESGPIIVTTSGGVLSSGTFVVTP